MKFIKTLNNGLKFSMINEAKDWLKNDFNFEKKAQKLGLTFGGSSR